MNAVISNILARARLSSSRAALKKQLANARAEVHQLRHLFSRIEHDSRDLVCAVTSAARNLLDEIPDDHRVRREVEVLERICASFEMMFVQIYLLLPDDQHPGVTSLEAANILRSANYSSLHGRRELEVRRHEYGRSRRPLIPGIGVRVLSAAFYAICRAIPENLDQVVFDDHPESLLVTVTFTSRRVESKDMDSDGPTTLHPENLGSWPNSRAEFQHALRAVMLTGGRVEAHLQPRLSKVQIFLPLQSGPEEA